MRLIRYDRNQGEVEAYGYSLNYFTNDYQPISTTVKPFATIDSSLTSSTTGASLYNGNIRAMLVNIPSLSNGSAYLYGYRYDQLNRIVAMDAFTGLNSSNSFIAAPTTDYQERTSYDPNGNIKSYLRHGDSRTTATGMDNLAYNYIPNTNQLLQVTDAITATLPTDYTDIKTQPANNYSYDPIGNLISDAQGGISNITWTVYGKIQTITKANGTVINYTYDASGNRISKTIGNNATYYVRDASGNVMSVYSSTGAGNLAQTELHMYGSSRIGIYNVNIDVTNTAIISPTTIFTRGNKFFELSNHLGNVLVTVSDKKIQHSSNNSSNDYYLADVVTANDYYPFGMAMPGRQYTQANSGYRYGFNSHEKSDEIAGEGNHTTALFGEYDTRLGRRWNPDPKPITGISIYSVFCNNPIWHSDILLDTPTVKEAALMDKLVYGDKLSKEDQSAFNRSGWNLSKVLPKRVQDQLANEKSGLKSSLFERTIGGKTEYALAFAGTEDIIKDGSADLKQIIGASNQYKQAFKNAGDVINVLGGAELTFTGHSLGGGLANASALYTGKASITFNPAWVSTATMLRYGLISKPQTGISNYVILGEVLNAVQRAANLNPIPAMNLLQNVGKTHFLYSTMPLVPIYGPLKSHTIGQVINEIKDAPEYNKVKGNGGASGEW